MASVCWVRIARATLLGVAALTAGGACLPSKTAPRMSATPDQNMTAAAQLLAQDLAVQLGRSRQMQVVVDPFLDRTTGQQTYASQLTELETKTAVRAALRSATFLDFDSEGAKAATFVLSGLVSTVAPDQYVVTASMTERQSGLVIAQAASRFRAPGLDGTPSAFYADSPSLVRDRSVEGYIRTVDTTAGQPADALYVEQIPTAALLAQALEAYNAGQWADALRHYEAAAARPDGQQLRTLNGVYLSYVRLGRTTDAEAAFGRIAALGLASGNLAVKFLFRPGSTDFWPDPSLTGMYPIWIRQIALALRRSTNCLSVIGHTSRSGSDSTNERLSLSRAAAVMALLEKADPEIAGRLKPQGMGFRQNIIGSGTDDARDSLDRRVEFAVVPCGLSQ